VIGAGYAGLAAADALRNGGAEVTVLEARDRVGGRVWSVPFNGVTIERGAEFILPGYEVMEGLAERFGIAKVLKGTPYGRRVPVGEEAVDPAELEGAFESIGEAAGGGSGNAAAAIDGLGLDPALARMVKTRVAISNGHPAEDLEVSVLEEGASTFGDFDNFTLKGGNMSLAVALADELAADLHLSDPVRRVAWSDGGVTITTDGGEVGADVAVIAIPAKPLAQVEFDPPLEGATAEALRSITYGQNSKLFLPLRSTEGVPASAIMSVASHFWTYTQFLPSGETAPFLTSYTGTAGAIEALGVGDPGPWIEATVALRGDVELDADPAAALLSTWHDDPWVGGSYSARSASSPLRDDELQRPLGPLHFAGEHTAGDWHGLMEGALRSGLRAAEQVLAAGRPIRS
jgi:monoamine oxidase